MERVLLTTTNHAQALEKAVAVLENGGLVVYPTETLYGVAADATNPAAVSKLLRFKRRPAGKPISVLVPDVSAGLALVRADAAAQASMQRLLPGPVTVVSPVAEESALDPRLLSEKNTLGVRVSTHPIAGALAKAFGKPLSATSANPSGGARPYAVDSLLATLSPRQCQQLDLILDAGTLPPNEPSTVVDFSGGEQTILRSGSDLQALARPLQSESEAETRAIARELTRSLFHAVREKPVILALSGEMGMGKTHFTKGVAEALQVTQEVTSPSYTLMKEYEGVVEGVVTRLVHLDCWRAETLSMSDLLLEDYLLPHTLLVIEWPAPLLSELAQLPPRAVVQHYAFTGTATTRFITLTAI